jgi:hypothetical protein
MSLKIRATKTNIDLTATSILFTIPLLLKNLENKEKDLVASKMISFFITSYEEGLKRVQSTETIIALLLSNKPLTLHVM